MHPEDSSDTFRMPSTEIDLSDGNGSSFVEAMSRDADSPTEIFFTAENLAVPATRNPPP